MRLSSNNELKNYKFYINYEEFKFLSLINTTFLISVFYINYEEFKYKFIHINICFIISFILTMRNLNSI